MQRYGIPTAPEGCGDEPELGACHACVVRAVRRGRWALRQVLPLKYSTYYFTGGPLTSAEPGHEGEKIEAGPTYVNVSNWRMWMGRVFAHDHKRWPIAV